MITLIFLWIFMPFFLLLLTLGTLWFGCKWVLHKLDASLEEDDIDSSHRR